MWDDGRVAMVVDEFSKWRTMVFAGDIGPRHSYFVSSAVRYIFTSLHTLSDTVAPVRNGTAKKKYAKRRKITLREPLT